MAPEEVKLKTETAPTLDLFTPIEKALQKAGIRAFFWGEFGTGKTYSALSFPEPVYVISTEGGVTPLAQHFKGKDIRILECSVPYGEKPVVKSTGQEVDEPFVVDPVLSLEKVEQATIALQNVSKGTIVIDSVSDIWEWLGSWLHYNAARSVSKSSGKEFMMQTEWQHANAKYKVLMFRLLTRPCNVVLTARSSPVYQDGNMTGTSKAKTQQNTPYWMDLVAQFQNRPMPEGTSGKLVNKRIVTITKCRFGDVPNPVIEDLTYDKLKTSLKGVVPDGVFQ